VSAPDPAAARLPYTFHLTIDVRPDGHDAYLAYKLEALGQLPGWAGHRWTLLLRAGAAHPDRYYQVSQFDSQASLDALVGTAASQEVVARHEPYRLMTRSPALREVVTVLSDDAVPGHASPAWCAHLRLAADNHPGQLAERLRGPGAGPSTGLRTVLLGWAGASQGGLALALAATAADARTGLPVHPASEAAVEDCKVLLDLPPR